MPDRHRNQNRTGLKIAALLMAVLLWYYVVTQGDLSAGAQTISVPLQYNNVPADLNVSGPTQVEVKIWGTFHGNLNIVAYVDVNGLGEGAHTLPVKLGSIQGAMFTSVNPKQVEIRLDKISEKTLVIKHEVKQNPPTGYQLASVLLAPDHCLVRGSADSVSRVTAVVASLDLANVQDIATVKSNLKAIDANGKMVTEGLQIVPATVNASVVLEKIQLSKKVNVKPTYSGSLAAGYTLGEVKSDPLQVTLLGDQTRVEAINEISTKPVDISGKQEDFVTQAELVLPEGVVLSPSRVSITVRVIKSPVGGAQ